ncbi:methyltransferase family protein [Pseudonocardia sediminis]|uniref:Methyltransferase family protein n=1 Tax=Pseudonocardia sediminis TaxID=1397368 RepID=A0A4Q7UZD0_PSEST|nr:methyltransferase domain-containing protein [Pseudonocardia sediminis]RZT85633.1 methyltransferase family protein [Pseudonocardia sediminis]
MTGDYQRRLDRGRRYWDRLSPVVSSLEQAAVAVDAYGLHHLDLAPGQQVLDIGCGAGAALPSLRGAVGPTGRVLGVDNSPRMLDLARGRLAESDWVNVDVLEADFARTTWPPGGFDAAVAVFALSAMADLPGALVVAERVLRPGGRLLVVDLNLTPRGWPAPLLWLVRELYRRRVGASAEDLLGAAGAVFCSVAVLDLPGHPGAGPRGRPWPPLTAFVATTSAEEQHRAAIGPRRAG